MKKVYITMVELPTFINKLVYYMTGFKYTHFSFSFTKSLEKMYSFQIKNKQTVLVGGFMQESEVFYFQGKKNINVKEIIYEIPVSDKDYKNIYNFIKKIEGDNEYIFNYISAWLMFPFGGVKAYKAYHCVEFISELLKLIPDINLPKKTYKMYPKDLYELLNGKYSFTEKIIFSNDYIIPQNDIFFQNIKISSYIKKALYNVKEAFCRAILNRTTKKYNYKNVNFYKEDIIKREGDKKC